MADKPASIRFNNPGAMYPGPVSRRFGSTGHEIIGGDHKIAVFPDAVSGAAAQFALLDSGGYSGMPLADAIKKWSGGNSSAAYAAEIARRAGVDPSARLTSEMLRNPEIAVPLARAMAGWEAGRGSPLTDEDWRAAHGRAFGATPGPTPAAAPPMAAPDDASAPWKPATPLTMDPAPFGMAGPPTAAPTAEVPSTVSAWAPTVSPEASSPFGLSAGDPKQMAALNSQMAAQAKEPDPMPQQLAMGGGRPVDLKRLMSVLQNRSRLGSGGMA